MRLTISEIHRRGDDGTLNDEWFILENPGDAKINTRGCSVVLARPGAKRGKPVAKMDPGFTLQPAGKIRVICGNPATKAHGKAPDDDVENYFLFMKQPLLRFPTGELRVVKGQLVLAKFDIG